MTNDLIQIKEAVTRESNLVSMAEARGMMDVLSTGQTMEAAMRAAQVSAYQRQKNQHIARQTFNHNPWDYLTISGASWLFNIFRTMHFDADGETLNGSTHVWDRPTAYGVYQTRWVCREDGYYDLSAYWRARVSDPLILLALMTKAELAYQLERTGRGYAQHPLFDTAVPAAATHPLGGVETPYTVAAGVATRTYLGGWYVSGADKFWANVGDSISLMSKITGVADGGIDYFEEFVTVLAIQKTGDFYTSEECC